jgi:hypothetical protein
MGNQWTICQMASCAGSFAEVLYQRTLVLAQYKFAVARKVEQKACLQQAYFAAGDFATSLFALVQGTVTTAGDRNPTSGPPKAPHLHNEATSSSFA